jgi:hypothetical protein
MNAKRRLFAAAAVLVALIGVFVVIAVSGDKDSTPRGSASTAAQQQAAIDDSRIEKGALRDDRYRSSVLETVVPRGSSEFRQSSDAAGVEEVSYTNSGRFTVVRVQPALSGESLGDLAQSYSGEGATRQLMLDGRRVVQVSTRAGGNSGAMFFTYDRGRLLTVMVLRRGNDTSDVVEAARRAFADSKVVASRPG